MQCESLLYIFCSVRHYWTDIPGAVISVEINVNIYISCWKLYIKK